MDYERAAKRLGISVANKTSELQLLRAIARKVGVSTSGTRADLKRRIAAQKRKYGYLKADTAAAGKRRPKKTTTGKRKKPRTQGRTHGRTQGRARMGRQRPATRKYLRKGDMVDVYTSTGQLAPGSTRGWRVLAVHQDGVELESITTRQREYLPYDSGYSVTRRRGRPPKTGRQAYYAAAEPEGYVDLHRARRHSSIGRVAPALARKQKRDELLGVCGPQCFGDREAMVPICPYCDTHRCYCHPECAELKAAYKHPSKGVDRDRVLYYASQLGCSWLPPSYYRDDMDDEQPSHRRKSDLSRRRSSSKRRRSSPSKRRSSSQRRRSSVRVSTGSPVSLRRKASRRRSSKRKSTPHKRRASLSPERRSSTLELIRTAQRSLIGKIFQYKADWYKILRVHTDGQVLIMDTAGKKYKVPFDELVPLLEEIENAEEEKKNPLKSSTETSQSVFHSADPKVSALYESILQKEGKISFPTLDNGGQPLLVTVKRVGNQRVDVVLSDNTLNNQDEDGETYPRSDEYRGFIYGIEDVDQVWVGSGSYNDVFDRSAEHFLGNTALIVKDQDAVSVSREIVAFQFKPGERVTAYISTVGNSAVAYGWIETTHGYYVLSGFNCVDGFLPKEKVDINKLKDGKWSLSCWEKSADLESISSRKVIVPRSY